MIEKIKPWFKYSVTILWARVLTLLGVVVVLLQDLLSDSTITGAVQSLFDQKYTPYVIIAIGVITELCRRRTAGRDD